jgi:DNA-binding IclR family transcriptional regulator
MIPKDDLKRSTGIQSLARASMILERIAEQRDGISLAQLAKAVGLHSSTTFHLAKTLVGLGYVRQDETNRHYHIGPMVFRLAAAAFDEIEMARTAAPFLDRLVAETGETAQFAVLSGTDALVLAQREAPGAFRIVERTGITRPVHATAIGKALLAAFAPADLDQFLERLTLEPLTPRTITDRGRLAEAVARIRHTGIAIEEGEVHPEIRCIAAPVRNYAGSIIASLGISAPIWRVAREDHREKLAALTSIAEELSAAFGYREPATGAKRSVCA